MTSGKSSPKPSSPERHWIYALLASGDDASWAYVLHHTRVGQDFVSHRAIQLRTARRAFTAEVLASPEGKQMAQDKVRDIRHALVDALDFERDDLLAELRRWKAWTAPQPTMKRFDVERIKEIPIADVMPSQPVQHYGDRLVYSCPLHTEKHGSFTVFTKDNKWHCFGACSSGGDVIDLVMQMENLTFIQACQRLQSGLT